MATATLNGKTVTACRVQIPASGVWFADVEIDRAEQLTGSVTLVLADLTLKGTILSGGPWQSRARYRIAGGAGGWGTVIPAKAYANDLGVKLANAIGDAARACGETLGSIPTGTTGPSFVRAEGPASRVLNELAVDAKTGARAWYVDEAGVTQFGQRPSVVFSGVATRGDRDLAQNRLELAATSIATLLPGVVVDGIEAVDVEHVLDDKLRTVIWGKGFGKSRLATAFDYLVDERTAHMRFFAPWEYRVVLRTGERLELQATRVSSGMPDLRNVRVRNGVPGCKGYPKLGSLVLVSFINGDPGRPVVTAFDDPESPGFIADDIFLEAGSTGSAPTEHATSAEALVLAFRTALETVATAATASGAPTAALAGQLALLTDDFALSGLVIAMGAGALGPLTKEAIAFALAAKTADTAGDTPSLGWPHVKGA